MKRIFLSVLLFMPLLALSQPGGRAVYKFLELPASARAAALGGVPITILDDDLALGFHNPSVLNPEMADWSSLSITDYYSDIYFGSALYARELENIGTASAGLQFIRYGDFELADEFGNRLGNFTAGDYNLQVGLGRKYQNLHYGANLKFIYSSYESYTSVGAALDLGATYYNPKNELLGSIVLKNVGLQFSSYSGNGSEPLPFQIQAGFSKRLLHTPFRFHVILHDLQQFDLTFVNPERDTRFNLETGEEEVDEPPYSEKIFRHFIIGTELLLNENFHIEFAYNHQRRKEMLLDSRKGLVGFSYGLGFRVNRFHIDFGRSTYHIAGATNHFTIATNFKQWTKKEN
ncbi:MAG: type IX secretion system protein PorQ [Bacteroidia bacterium]